jgi:hypothetical protein
MTTRILRLLVDEEFGRLLALYLRRGEKPRGALLIALRLRATADGLLLPNGRIKNGGRS